MLLKEVFRPPLGRLPRNLISALEALLPLADVKPATTPTRQVCIWTSKVARLHRS